MSSRSYSAITFSVRYLRVATIPTCCSGSLYWPVSRISVPPPCWIALTLFGGDTAKTSAFDGYRVYGPFDPSNGHRFNPNKLVLDPYARALYGSLKWNDAHFGYRTGSPRADLSLDRRDSARGMPKCRVAETEFSWGDDRPPRRAWDETVIYEMHLRGFTMAHPESGTIAMWAKKPRWRVTSPVSWARPAAPWIPAGQPLRGDVAKKS